MRLIASLLLALVVFSGGGAEARPATQSYRDYASISKLVKLAQLGQIPSYVAPAPSGNCTPGSQASAFLARTSGLNTAETNAVCTVINTLFSTAVTTPGLTGTLGDNTCAAYFPASNNTTNAKLNLITASFTLIQTGTFTFTPDFGFTGDGSTGSFDTGLTQSTCTVQNANSLGFTAFVLDNRTSGDGSVIVSAANTNAFSILQALTTGGNIQWDANDNGTFPTVANSTAKGAYTVVRTSSSATAVYKNGSSTPLATSTAAVGLTPAVNYTLFALNNASAISAWSSDQGVCFGFHAGFNGADASAWQNACNAGLAILGANVY